MIWRRIGAALALACATLAGQGAAQEVLEDAPTRYPDDGIAILDCDPPAPAPAESCLLRLPIGHDYTDPDIEPLGATRGEFRITREGRTGFPDGLRMAETLLLVDLSPGPQGGRRATFEVERGLIRDFLAELPSGASVAIYGFNEGLTRIADFTTDRARLREAVDGLALGGTNTRIATALGDAVAVLAERDDVLVRNIVVVSDGQEEGQSAVSGVIAAAEAAGVSISSIGAFWRPVGTGASGSGMDYLEGLARPTRGTAVRAILRRPEEAADVVAAFGRRYAAALERSALIVPEGAPQPSRITLRLSEPVLGRPDETRARTIGVVYRPEAEAAAPRAAAPEPEPRAATILGLPALWVFAGAALLALVVLGSLVAVRARAASEEPEPELELDEADAPEIDAPPPPPAAPVRAWLVLTDTGRRVAIRDDRVNVGRSSANEVVIEHRSVSRVHAQIHVNRDGGFSVTDLDSLNKTRVAGQPITGTSPLRLGESLQFGEVSAKLVAS